MKRKKLQTLNILDDTELAKLTEARLRAYRKRVLAVWDSVDHVDISPVQLARLDKSQIAFKTDPQWSDLHNRVNRQLEKISNS